MTAINCMFKHVLKNSLQILMALSVAFLLFGMPTKAYAKYTLFCVERNVPVVKPGHISINTDDPSNYPVGTLITEPFVDSYEIIFTFTGTQCSGSGTSTWADNQYDSPVGTYSSPEGILPVFNLYTNSEPYTAGIGYAMSLADPNQPYHALDKTPVKLWSVDNMVSEGALGLRFNLYLITIGPLVPGNYAIPLTVLGGVCLSSSATINTEDFCVAIDTSPFIITVNASSCDINADTPSTVNLTRINASDLPKKGDVGNNVDFTISLKCNAATTVNMTLTDPNGGDAENGVLYSDTGQGLAQNVGVQVLSAKDGGQTPQTVHLNETFTVGNASEGQYSIPMAARYYRTSDSEIVGGKVSASVVYELSYQ